MRSLRGWAFSLTIVSSLYLRMLLPSLAGTRIQVLFLTPTLITRDGKTYNGIKLIKLNSQFLVFLKNQTQEIPLSKIKKLSFSKVYIPPNDPNQAPRHLVLNNRTRPGLSPLPVGIPGQQTASLGEARRSEIISCIPQKDVVIATADLEFRSSKALISVDHLPPGARTMLQQTAVNRKELYFSEIRFNGKDSLAVSLLICDQVAPSRYATR
jgi:hypothetical protein